MSRGKARKILEKSASAENTLFSKDDLRWATNKMVAEHRAERLKCRVIADLCCGIGFQAIAFAKRCEKVYAVDSDPSKIENTKKNCTALGINNIIFINGDVLDNSVIKKLKDCDAVFCDPERPESESERVVDSIKPNPNELLAKYKMITGRIAVEMPPQIKHDDFDAEHEYASVNGMLNRLTLYFGELKTDEVSCISLPSGERLAGKRQNAKQGGKLMRYLYEIDTAAQKAGLLKKLEESTGAKLYEEQKFAFFTSENLIRSAFFRNSFEVIETCDPETRKIIEVLRKNNAGEAVIRYSIDPKDYWKERKWLESRLTGAEKLFVFRLRGKGVVARKM